MTQAIYRQKLKLSLTSMQPAEAVVSKGLSFKDSKIDELVGNELLLRPGEPAQMLVRLENVVNGSLRWKIKVEGDFPLQWCWWNQPEFEEIAPNQKQDREITFQIPEDFFENQSALSDEKPRLQINYQSQIYVYLEEGREQQLIEYQVINLLVRPTTSYINFLPGIYREVDFARRLIGIFEQAFDPVIQTSNILWAYLDPLTAPEAMLPFLAHWVGWEMDRRWDIEKQRHLIRNCSTLYRWHGTRYGLWLYLHLYTGLSLEQIIIREIFEQGFVLGATRIGEDSMLGGGCPYHFIVELRPDNSEQINEAEVREIIERQKPAFCTYDLNIVSP